MTVLISLYSSAGVVAFKARSIALASISALVIVVLQNLTVSAMSSSESFSTFSYQDAKNWSSWLPIDGSISILKFQGMILSLMQIIYIYYRKVYTYSYKLRIQTLTNNEGGNRTDKEIQLNTFWTIFFSPVCISLCLNLNFL